MTDFVAKFLTPICLAIGVISALPAIAEIRLASKWQERTPEGKWFSDGESEGEKMQAAARSLVVSNSAIPVSEDHIGVTTLRLPFQLFINENKFYIQPATFMAKTRPNEICTPDLSKSLTYICKEGQRHTEGCHVLFFNSNFENVGTFELKIKAPFQYYCNAVPAVGTGDKKENELLITVQYFAIDQEKAKSISELGEGWIRQTILARVKVVDGKIQLEQDDACLGNPNTIDAIPDARVALNKCVLPKR